MTKFRIKRARPRTPKNPYIWKDQRKDDLRTNIDLIIDALVRNYADTDPAKGTVSEFRKSQVAQQTIELWWVIYADLVVWAQRHITGKIWAQSNPDLTRELASVWGVSTLNENSHFFERIGHDFGSNAVSLDDPLFFYLAAKEERDDIDYVVDLTQEQTRSIIREMMLARSGHEAFWRNGLTKALLALNHGQAIEPLVPSSVRKRGDFIDTLEWKSNALCHVAFMVGQGTKKHVALERVAKALHQSTETLRSWEKMLSKDEDFVTDTYCARLAGQFEAELDDNRIDELEETYGDEGFRNRSYWQIAHTQLQRVRNISLERIKTELQYIRSSTIKTVPKKPIPIPKKR